MSTTINKGFYNNWPFTDAVNVGIYEEYTVWPKITIITPSYNQSEFIEETILSVLNQNYPYLEYIIIDGGSTDNTVEIIKQYQHNLSYWVSEKDRGQSHAINKGLAIASGDLVGYLNSDDILLPSALYYLAKAYINAKKTNSSPLILGGHAILGETLLSANDVFRNNYEDWDVVGLASTYGNCPQPSTFWQKGEVLFNEDLMFCMDFDYWVKLVANGYKFCKIDKDLSFYRIHPKAKGKQIVDIMWLELTALTYIHSKLVTDAKARQLILKSSKLKKRNYLISVLNTEKNKVTKHQLAKMILSIIYNNCEVCFNFRFVKFLIGLLLKRPEYNK